MDELTRVCLAIKRVGASGVYRYDSVSRSGFWDKEFTASDLDLGFEPSSPQVVGRAFRLLAKSSKNPFGVIVKVRPVQSQGRGRNGSLVWSWKLV